MKWKMLVLCTVSMFLLTCFSSMSIIGANVKKEIVNSETFLEEPDADTPIWEVGNYWTYDITINGGIPKYLDINNLKMDDLKFTVEEVNDDSYTVSFSCDVTGNVVVKVDIIQISGNFQDTDLEGTLIVNKSKLTINEVADMVFDGYIKPNILPKIPINIAGDCLFFYQTPLLDFPINNGESWIANEIYLQYDLVINLLPDPAQDSIFIEGHYVECLDWDIVTVPAGEFDALELSSDLGDEHTVWYAVSAGNAVKVRSRGMPLNGGYYGDYDIDITLQSTNFEIESDPPSTPTIIEGPSEVIAGFPEDYTFGGSIDPDGDMIRYIVDWGDGTVTGTDFVDSGESAIIDHYWSQKGSYQIKTKARDKYGQQSGWSDPVTITVLNEAPLKPDPPTGPTSGHVRNVYTYYATTIDPDGHRIRYEFDWGDGQTSYSGLVNSGDSGSASHSWRWRGTYQIKVKAVDEWGEESPWSDPLSVSMPRVRFANRPILNIFDKISRLFPIVHMILEKLGTK